MIDGGYFFRHWAETLRLYTGWLDEDTRNTFIKKLGQQNILLAAECRANFFSEDYELDEYLAKIAVENAKELEKTKISANGLLALTVLEKYDEILAIFKSSRSNKSNLFYSEVISDLVRNGSESQILEFLRILSSSNAKLLEKAYDNIIDASIILSPDAKDIGLKILKTINKENEILKLKTICLFQLSGEINNPQDFLYKIIRVKELKYAYRLSSLTQIKVDVTILNFLDEYLSVKEKGSTINIFLNTLGNLHLSFDEEEINLRLSKDLNPVIKKRALYRLKGERISNQLAYRLCKENINIGNKSSIEFADDLITEFNLQDTVDRDALILVLLQSKRFQSIELAYRIIKRYSLYDKFNFRIVFDLLVGSIKTESLQFARKLVFDEFPISEKNDLLMHIVLLSFQNKKPTKLTKQILLNDFNGNTKELNSQKTYYGHVSNFYKKTYQINMGNGKQFSLSGSAYRFKIDDFITFQISEPLLSLTDLNIKITSINPLKKQLEAVWFQNNYIGQVIDIQITCLKNTIAIGKKEGSIMNYTIPISEIENSYILDISEKLKIGRTYSVKIKSFDIQRKSIVCSIKDLQIDSHKQFIDKIQILKNKYKNK